MFSQKKISRPRDFRLSRLEGIIPAIETAHAFSVFDKLDMKGKVVVVNLSGRGDKDLETYIKWGKY